MIGLTAKVKGAAELNRWAKRVGGQLETRTRKLVTSTALAIERDARLLVSVKTQNLKSDIHTEFDFTPGRARARIGTNVSYGPHLEYGTGIWGPKHAKYEIRPKTKKALAFYSAAATQLGTSKALYRSARRPGALVKTRKAAARVVVRKVMHPGISPRPFLGPAFERHLPVFVHNLGLIIEHLRKAD